MYYEVALVKSNLYSLYPTPPEMKSNLSACYLSWTIETALKMNLITGLSIQIDKIKIQECLQWEPSSDHILGVCQEHGRKYSGFLEFRSIYQADNLLNLLKTKDVHLATEVHPSTS